MGNHLSCACPSKKIKKRREKRENQLKKMSLQAGAMAIYTRSETKSARTK